MKEKSPLKKYLAGLIILTLIAFIILFLLFFRKNQDAKINCIEDQNSGETICSTDYENEIGNNSSNNSNTIFTGLSFLDENGFSNPQQDTILANLKAYFTSYEKISYEKNSFNYDPVETESGLSFNKSHFKLISNSSEVFLVKLDTKGSISSISISIEKSN